MALRSLGLAATLALLAAGPLAAEPLAIVVSAEWQRAREIDLRDLRAVYLGRRTRLFGEHARRIDLPPGSAARAGFSRSVLERSEQALERYWIEQALSGGALPPRQVKTPADVIAAVKQRVGTLGYVPVSEIAKLDLRGVRTLRLVVGGIARDPADGGYPAHTVD